MKILGNKAKSNNAGNEGTIPNQHTLKYEYLIVRQCHGRTVFLVERLPLIRSCPLSLFEAS